VPKNSACGASSIYLERVMAAVLEDQGRENSAEKTL
jgi:hypothetical protein